MVDRYSDDDDNNEQTNEKFGYLVKENVLSTIPSSVEFNPSKRSSLDVCGELELARKEIAELKKQLTDITAEKQG